MKISLTNPSGNLLQVIVSSCWCGICICTRRWTRMSSRRLETVCAWKLDQPVWCLHWKYINESFLCIYKHDNTMAIGEIPPISGWTHLMVFLSCSKLWYAMVRASVVRAPPPAPVRWLLDKTIAICCAYSARIVGWFRPTTAISQADIPKRTRREAAQLRGIQNPTRNT